jgi:hypothetical protein
MGPPEDWLRIDDVAGAIRRDVRQIAKRSKYALGSGIAHMNVPDLVDDERRIRFLLFQYELQRASNLLKLRGVDLTVRVFRGETGGKEQVVLIGERNIERVAKQLNHIAARLGTACLQKAQVAG